MRFAEATCGLRVADSGKVEQGQSGEDWKVMHVCIKGGDEVRGSEQLGFGFSSA